MKLRRVTANIPAELLEVAMQATGKGLTATLIEGLEHLRRRRAYARALELRGKLQLDVDLDASRERGRR
jgi:hypothetical protein